MGERQASGRPFAAPASGGGNIVLWSVASWRSGFLQVGAAFLIGIDTRNPVAGSECSWKFGDESAPPALPMILQVRDVIINAVKLN